MRIAVVVAALVVGSVAPARADGDAAFRDAVQTLAAGTGRCVGAWGTAHLDGSARPHRFATLLPERGDRGAYVIEAAPDAVWLVTFDLDSTTQPFRVGDGAECDGAAKPWTAGAETELDHAWSEMGPPGSGSEGVAVGLRGRELVVLGYDYDGGTSGMWGQAPIADRYARASAPPLATLFTRDLQLAVAGPARVADLVEPTYRPLHVDLEHVALASDADALALWRRIAPQGENVADELNVLSQAGPATPQHLALAAIRAGGFTCTAAHQHCGAASPAPHAGFDDPCVRHAIVLWALQTVQNDPTAVSGIADALRAIATLPPGDAGLVDAAVAAADDAPALQHELAAIAWRAGHHDSAVVDHALAPGDLAALAATSKPADCGAAALAALVRERAGDASLVPRPTGTSPAALTRQLCVLASYLALGGTGASLTDFVARDGLDQLDIRRVDPDGMTEGDKDHVARSDAADQVDLLAEVVDGNPSGALAVRCTGATCTTDRRAFTFDFARERGRLVVTQLAIERRAGCP